MPECKLVVHRWSTPIPDCEAFLGEVRCQIVLDTAPLFHALGLHVVVYHETSFPRVFLQSIEIVNAPVYSRLTIDAFTGCMVFVAMLESGRYMLREVPTIHV